MKIAVTHENEQVFQHFGHTKQFKLYHITDGKITSRTVIDTNGQGHGALATILKTLQADVLICGGIGAGAQTALSQAGIKLFGGVSGNCDEAVEAYLSGKLSFNPYVGCSHHDHEHRHEDHVCGNHGCGNGNCHH